MRALSMVPKVQRHSSPCPGGLDLNGAEVRVASEETVDEKDGGKGGRRGCVGRWVHDMHVQRHHGAGTEVAHRQLADIGCRRPRSAGEATKRCFEAGRGGAHFGCYPEIGNKGRGQNEIIASKNTHTRTNYFSKQSKTLSIARIDSAANLPLLLLLRNSLV